MEERIRKESKRFGEPLPKKIENKPDLYLGSALFLNAWFDLDTERDRPQYQRITRSMCFAYAEDYGFDEEQREDLWYFIKRMDQEFMEWWIKRQPKPKGPKGGKNAKAPR